MPKKILKIIFCRLKIFDTGALDDLYLLLICADQRATKLLASNAGTRCLGFFKGEEGVGHSASWSFADDYSWPKGCNI